MQPCPGCQPGVQRALNSGCHTLRGSLKAVTAASSENGFCHPWCSSELLQPPAETPWGHGIGRDLSLVTRHVRVLTGGSCVAVGAGFVRAGAPTTRRSTWAAESSPDLGFPVPPDFIDSSCSVSVVENLSKHPAVALLFLVYGPWGGTANPFLGVRAARVPLPLSHTLLHAVVPQIAMWFFRNKLVRWVT